MRIYQRKEVAMMADVFVDGKEVEREWLGGGYNGS